MRRRTSAEKNGIHASIRKFKASDHDACRNLWANLTIWHRQIYNDPTIGGSDPAAHFDNYLREHGSRRLWIAEIKGKIVGMAGIISANEGPELEPLVVGSEYRRCGIGRLLTEKVIQAARREGAKILHVRPVARNEPAIRFFHDCGFDILGHIEMFIDLAPASRQRWKSGKRIAGKDFKS